MYSYEWGPDKDHQTLTFERTFKLRTAPEMGTWLWMRSRAQERAQQQEAGGAGERAGAGAGTGPAPPVAGDASSSGAGAGQPAPLKQHNVNTPWTEAERAGPAPAAPPAAAGAEPPVRLTPVRESVRGRLGAPPEECEVVLDRSYKRARLTTTGMVRALHQLGEC